MKKLIALALVALTATSAYAYCTTSSYTRTGPDGRMIFCTCTTCNGNTNCICN